MTSRAAAAAFHVVCHTCATEGALKHEWVAGEESEAERIVENHRERTEHDVEYRRVTA